MPIKVSESLVLYDVEELARLLDVQAVTVRKLFRAGKIKGRKLARKWYTTEADLQAFFSQPEPEPGDDEEEEQDEPSSSS